MKSVLYYSNTDIINIVSCVIFFVIATYDVNSKSVFFFILILGLAYCLNLYCKPSNFTKLTMAPRETRESAKATPKIQRTVSKTKVKASPVPAIKKTAVTGKLVEATPIKGMHYI